MTRRNRLPLFGSSWFAIALVLGAIAPSAAQTPARVKVDAVKSEPLSQTVPILGRLVSREQGQVAASVAGPVEKILVQVGDRVEIGQLIAQLVTDRREAMITTRKSDLAMRRARLSSANAQLEISRDEMKRLEKLKSSSAFPRARYEDQQHDVVRFTSARAEARAALTRTEAEVAMAQIELERTQIKAPYDAVVTRRHVSAGAYVRLGDPVVTLLNDVGLEVEADVPSDRIAGLVPGATVVATLDDGTVVPAAVRAIIPDENPLTRTRQVRFTANLASRENIAVNQSVTVQVPVGKKRTVVSVHKDAIINRKGKQMVFVVHDGKASPRPVKLGEAVGARFEVLDGLKVGDQTVVRGNERLRPGQAVKAQPGT
jgi:RND family efflux transporter MFP subunit